MLVSRRPLATPEQVSEYLGVPVGTLTMWRYRKVGMRFSKVGRHVRYDWADVDAWLAEQSSNGAA